MTDGSRPCLHERLALRRPPRRALAAVMLVVLAIPPGVPALSHAASRDRWPSRRYARELARADTLLSRDRRLAHPYLDSLIAAARARGDSSLVMVAAVRLASVRAFFEGRLEDAQRESRRWLPAIRVSRDTLTWCIALRTIGYADLASERYAAARADYAELLALARRARLLVPEGYALIGTSYLAMQQGRMAGAERGYRAAIRRLEGHEPWAARTARAGLANALFWQLKPDESRREYERVLADSRAAGDLRNEADALNDLGSIEFEYGDPSRAAPLFRESAAAQRALGRGLLALHSTRNVAMCLHAQGRLDESAALMDSVARAAGAARAFDLLARSLGELGSIRQTQGRLAEAETTLRRAVALRDSISTQAWADGVAQLARVEAMRGRARDAAATARKALDALGPHAEAESREVLLHALGLAAIAAGEPAAALGPVRESAAMSRGLHGAQGSRVIDCEATLALAFGAMGLRDSAIVHYRKAADAWERARAEPNDLAWRETFGAAAAKIYGPYAAALLDPGRGGDAASRAAEAFEALQRFRARTLEDALRGAEARTALPRISLARLQRVTLRPGEVLLDLFVAPDTTFMFVVSRGEIRVAGAPGAEHMTPRLRRFRDLLAGGDGDTQALASASAALGEQLLGSVGGRLRASTTLLLSAGSLAEFPLGMLRLPGEEAPMAVLHRVALVPSATLLAAGRDARPARGASGGLMALGRSTGPGGRRLEGVARESRWLAGRFPGARVRLNDGDRPLEAMLADLGSSEVLHVASHTRVPAAAPWRAGYLLGRGEGEDAYLTASRIARLPAVARVCVLASCTSAGSATNAEGLPNLASAWLAAGASAVIATLWSVDDRTTAEFIEDFYGALARGQSTGEAVASAQLAARASADRNAERFWGGFVLLGDPSTRVGLARADGGRGAPPAPASAPGARAAPRR